MHYDKSTSIGLNAANPRESQANRGVRTEKPRASEICSLVAAGGGSGGIDLRGKFDFLSFKQKEIIEMKNLALILLLFCLANPAAADFLVVDIDPPNSDTNPQWITPSNPATEKAWLDGLLGLGSDVPFIFKDEDSNPLDNVPANWTYAILKYGVGQPSIENPDHWAVYDSNFNDIIDFESGWGLPTTGLSHISYFGAATVPEPATMFLLGLGLIGLSGFARKKFRK